MAPQDFLFEMVLFLASALLGLIAGLLSDRRQKQLAGSLAILLLVVSVSWVSIDALLSQPGSQNTPQPADPTHTPQPTSPSKTPAPVEPTQSPIRPTNTPQPARIYDFQACPEPCDGSNETITFPMKTAKIYLTWKYENIPSGAHYVRTWSLDGREWVRFDCMWGGPSSGQEEVNPLAEAKGLASGVWEMVIRVDDKVLLRENVTVEGRWDYWDPEGVYHSCYER